MSDLIQATSKFIRSYGSNCEQNSLKQDLQLLDSS